MSVVDRRQLWVKGRLRDDVGITTGIPRIAAALLRRPSRQSRANKRHPGPGNGPVDTLVTVEALMQLSKRAALTSITNPNGGL